MLKKVVIDSDPATGVPYRDVDDGLAFLVLLAVANIEVQGITITHGNVGVDTGFEVAKKLMDLIHSDVPVYKGAACKADLGVFNPAVEYLIETVRAHPGEISLLGLGPLTNIATAMQLDTGFSANLKELVIMGGSFHFWPFSTFGEFNFHMDGRAASIVLQSSVKKTVITMDVCSKAVFRREQLAMLKMKEGPVSEYLIQVISPWLEINRKVFFQAQGFFPWDVVAAAYLADSTLFDINPLSFSVRESGLRSGSIFELKAEIENENEFNVPMKLDTVRFMKLFMDGLTAY